jgi:hypothetical protein
MEWATVFRQGPTTGSMAMFSGFLALLLGRRGELFLDGSPAARGAVWRNHGNGLVVVKLAVQTCVPFAPVGLTIHSIRPLIVV